MIVQADPIDQLWWIFLAGTLVALILSAAFIASMIIQQRRYVATTREFGGRLLLAQEEERAWVARELHDDLIQRVAMLGHELDELERTGAGGDPLRLAGIREELHDLAGEIRRIAHHMHPTVLDHLGLPAALVQLGAEFEAQGLPVRIEAAARADALPAHVATCLFRVAQEALRNALRHSGASEAVLALRHDPGGLSVSVSDSGAGFDPEAAAALAGLGLTSLRERVRLLQGRLTVRSHPGRGTTVTAWVPLEEDG